MIISASVFVYGRFSCHVNEQFIYEVDLEIWNGIYAFIFCKNKLIYRIDLHFFFVPIKQMHTYHTNYSSASIEYKQIDI